MSLGAKSMSDFAQVRSSSPAWARSRVSTRLIVDRTASMIPRCPLNGRAIWPGGRGCVQHPPADCTIYELVRERHPFHRGAAPPVKALVTGATGFIGGHLCLAKRDGEVVPHRPEELITLARRLERRLNGYRS